MDNLGLKLSEIKFPVGSQVGQGYIWWGERSSYKSLLAFVQLYGSNGGITRVKDLAPAFDRNRHVGENASVFPGLCLADLGSTSSPLPHPSILGLFSSSCYSFLITKGGKKVVKHNLYKLSLLLAVFSFLFCFLFFFFLNVLLKTNRVYYFMFSWFVEVTGECDYFINFCVVFSFYM